MGFVADLNHHKLAPMEHEGGWEVYDLLYARAKHEGLIGSSDFLTRPLALVQGGELGATKMLGERGKGIHRPVLSIPAERFSRLQLDIPLFDKTHILRSMLLKVEGKDFPVPPSEQLSEEPSPHYRLTVIPGTPLLDRGMAILRAECWLGESQSRTSLPLFRIFPFMEQAKSVSSGLKAKKRRALLYETFFRLCQVQKRSEAKKIVQACLREDEFRAFRVRAEAERVLQRFSAPALEPSVRMTIHQGHWCFVANNWVKESLLYSIPYSVWGAPLFEGMQEHDEMMLPLASLSPRLPELYTKLQEVGIELFYQNKPIVTAQWECSVDARRPSTIDWFELRPEIICEGVRIDPQDIEKILQRGGIMETDDDPNCGSEHSRDLKGSGFVVPQASHGQEEPRDHSHREDSKTANPGLDCTAKAWSDGHPSCGR
jgi:hypothetical protein